MNLLSNMYTEGMAPIVGQRAAQALNLIVRGGYLVCLLGSFLLFMFPLRTTLAEVLARDSSGSSGSGRSNSSRRDINGLQGSISDVGPVPEAAGTDPTGTASADTAADKLVARHFYSLTYGLLLLIVAAAVFVPNIWAALSLVGDVASTVEGFIVPALIALALAGWSVRLRHSESRVQGSWWSSCLAVFVLVLGAALFVNGILQHTLLAQR